MFGYITWERSGRPGMELARRDIGGAPFLALEVRGDSRRLRRRVLRAAAQMERLGVRRCVMPPDWPEAWRGGLRPVEEMGLRQALFPKLLSAFCARRGLLLAQETTLLSAPCPTPAVWAAAELLAQRSRYLILSVESGEGLRRALWEKYGLSAGGGKAAMQVCFAEPLPSIPALLLGAESDDRQRVSYGLDPSWAARLGEYPVTPQLAAALWESGVLPLSALEVKSLGNGA